MKMNKREYRRVAANVNIRFSGMFQGKPLDKPSFEYMEGVAQNFGPHGIFVETDQPFPKGSLVVLDFDLLNEDQEMEKIRARALVKWVQKWQKPHGMGLLLVEFEGVSQRSFARWITQLYEKEEEAGNSIYHE